MSRYIDADKLMEIYKNELLMGPQRSRAGMQGAIQILYDFSSVDAVEVERLKTAIYRALVVNADETKHRYELGKKCVDAFLNDCIKYAKMDGESE